MREVIITDDLNEIPEDYKYDTERSDIFVYRHKYTGDEIHIAKEPPLYVHAVPIPQDATNGDVIQAMFPTAHIFIDTSDNDYQYVYVNYPSAGSSWKLRKEWWDSSWKGRDANDSI